jgi:ribosome-associated toxin RatA of RatAB toxin-antitoxin module
LLELAEFLSRRYPTVYTVTRRKDLEGSWFDEPNEICAVEIPDLGVRYDFDSVDPMEIAGLIQPADLAVMMEGEDSMYYMKAGFIALAGSWRFEDKSESAVALSLATSWQRSW